MEAEAECFEKVKRFVAKWIGTVKRLCVTRNTISNATASSSGTGRCIEPRTDGQVLRDAGKGCCYKTRHMRHLAKKDDATARYLSMAIPHNALPESGNQQ